MAITATFSGAELNVTGDTLDNTTTVGRNGAGQLLVNGGAVPVANGTPTVANTAQIEVFGLAGNDTIAIDEANGAVPRANLFGGLGNDALNGGSGNDQLFGEAGNDTLLGRGGSDLLFGGNDNDTLTGGDGDDQIFGGSGNDRMIWNPGDDSDFNEGGAGIDTTEVNGGGGAEQFTIVANGERVLFNRIDPAPFAIDIGTTENLVLNANGGDDTISATGNLAPLIRLTLDGGAGNDTIRGGNGADVLLGGLGDDFVDGQQGNDVAFLGDGDDVFQWDPGDGSDVVEGQNGSDTMLFNGSAANERSALSANGDRTTFTRDIANITMDLDGVETIDMHALGGADTLTIGDMAGTDVRRVNVDLAETTDAADSVIFEAQNGFDLLRFRNDAAGLLSTGNGVDVAVVNAGALDRVVADVSDSGFDFVNFDGSARADTFRVTASATDVLVDGLNVGAAVRGGNTDDRITIATGAGDDLIEALGNLAAGPSLRLDGGTGNDTIRGGNGADVLLGGDGNDFVDGQGGNDTALLGAGDDVFRWDPGDGSDIIDGQAGFDTHEFNGSAGAEIFSLAAGGGDVLLTRNLGNIVMDQKNVERVELAALGGRDTIDIADLRDTDVRQLVIDLAGTAGGTTGDTVEDAVSLQGTTRSDFITLSSSGDSLTVNGLAAATRIDNLDANDRVAARGGAGNDVLSALGVGAGGAQIALDGGAGNDTLVANSGGAELLGGAGNDLLVGNGGKDILNAGTGRDLLFGGGGDDLFVGEDDYTILDFRAGAGSDDRIDLRGVAGLDDFGDVMASARKVLGGVMLDFGDDEITLLGVSVGQLHQDDFLI